MKPQQNKKPIDKFVLILAAIVIVVAGSLPLSNRAPDVTANREIAAETLADVVKATEHSDYNPDTVPAALPHIYSELADLRHTTETLEAKLQLMQLQYEGLVLRLDSAGILEAGVAAPDKE